MPPQAVVILIIIAVLMLLLRALAGGNPAHIALIIRRTLAGGCLLVAVMLLGRGLLPAAIPLFLLGLIMLGTGSRYGINFPWGQKSPGQKSAVRTEMLAMELDHDSGELDGAVLAGRFTGRRLAELTLQDLMALRGECITAGDQSAALLDAFLDRMQPNWRDESGEDEAANAGPSDAGHMTADEAYSILGLAPGSEAAEIRKAHRRMMKRFHPDQGGSEYLAQKINQARDLLLSGSS